MSYAPNIIFLLLLSEGLCFFVGNIIKLKRNILLGTTTNRSDQTIKRWKNMLRVALGQGKMIQRPIAGILHIIVYLGFIIINVEVLEIILDGILGTHRLFDFMGIFYYFLIGSFELLALLVLVSVLIFWTRRNLLAIKRFKDKELKGWAKNDGNLILYFEMILMSLFLVMNATDLSFQSTDRGNIISCYFYPFFSNYSETNLYIIERTSWWLHIIGIIIFLNYLYYSKHLHIFLAFPNTYYANLKPYGTFSNNSNVTKEVAMMLDPNANPFASNTNNDDVGKFGAEDVQDLSWVQLMNAYSCTECGRCNSVCPANITGKKLSPRNIMMKTRDCIESLSNELDHNLKREKKLLGGYISPEEIWACTTCNACVEECPINIDPLSIIMDLRQFLVMEKSAAPSQLNTMMTNIENNGAPWQYNQEDRLNWV